MAFSNPNTGHRHLRTVDVNPRIHILILRVLNPVNENRSENEWKELELYTDENGELYVRLVHPVPSRWMRVMKDADVIRGEQLFNDRREDMYCGRMIERLHTVAIQLFVKETETRNQRRYVYHVSYH